MNLKTTQVTPCKTEWPNKLCLHHGNVLPPATACFGDSGGPLIVNEGGYSVVIGVANVIVDTTNLTSPTTKCNPTKGVSMYSEVQAYLPWIKSKIGQGQNIIYATRSLGALQAPTSSRRALRPSRPSGQRDMTRLTHYPKANTLYKG